MEKRLLQQQEHIATINQQLEEQHTSIQKLTEMLDVQQTSMNTTHEALHTIKNAIADLQSINKKILSQIHLDKPAPDQQTPTKRSNVRFQEPVTQVPKCT